jgi:hypothetical protein
MSTGLTPGMAYVLGLSLATIAPAAEASQIQVYDWAQVQRQNEAARQRGIEQEQRVCRSIAQSGRVKLPAACRARMAGRLRPANVAIVEHHRERARQGPPQTGGDNERFEAGRSDNRGKKLPANIVRTGDLLPPRRHGRAHGGKQVL